MSNKLTASELVRAGNYGVDHDSVLFHHDGGLFRGFRGETAKRLSALSDDDWAFLARSGLIEVTRPDISVEGFPFVLRVHEIWPVTYPTEWPTTLLSSAAVTTLSVAGALSRFGLRLKDAHPWNVLFDGTEPRFVDLGSIVPGEEVDPGWVEEFQTYFLAPLMLFAVGQHRAARALIRLHRHTPIAPLLRRTSFVRRLPLAPWTQLRAARGDATLFYDSLVTYITQLRVQGQRTRWSDYVIEEPAIGDTASYDAKRGSVDKFLTHCPGATVLDIASNQGWYSRLALHHGYAHAVAVDIDDFALCALHASARSTRLPISVVRSDIMWPVGSYGLTLAYGDLYARLQSDTVLAVAILHHLVNEHGIRFEAFARLMDRLARNAVIVEFIPADDQHVSQWPVAKEAWYNLESLVRAMSAYFPDIVVVDSSPAPRKMLCCRRIQVES